MVIFACCLGCVQVTRHRSQRQRRKQTREFGFFSTSGNVSTAITIPIGTVLNNV